MTARNLPDDAPFFGEWSMRRTGERRSLRRAEALARAMGVAIDDLPPVLTVVGSKGKGTAVATATVTLRALGLRVGTVTSPAFRTNRERVRLDGRAMSAREYREMSERVASATRSIGPADDGYLSPSGAFLIGGVAHLLRADAEVLVLEEGLGGASDEVSLLPPDIVALTPVFLEHQQELGDSIEAIVADLLGVVGPSTRRMWTTRTQDVAVPYDVRISPAGHAVPVQRVHPSTALEAAASRIPGLGAENALVGSVAALDLVGAIDRVSERSILEAVGALSLPGRLSVHPPGRDRRGTWVIDAAVSPDAVSVASRWASEEVGDPALVIASWPTGKDRDACRARLDGMEVLEVCSGAGHLAFAPGPDGRPLPALGDILGRVLASDGPVLLLGTISFVAEALDLVDADTGLW